MTRGIEPRRSIQSRARLSGGAPEQITDFGSDRIFAFAQSHDGRRLAVARGTVQSDVVLIQRK
jgi:hypothetical protein